MRKPVLALDEVYTAILSSWRSTNYIRASVMHERVNREKYLHIGLAPFRRALAQLWRDGKVERRRRSLNMPYEWRRT